jgi:thioredoxin-related protein
MSYESHKYYYGNLYANNAKDVKNQQLFMDLHASIVMDVKTLTIITRSICRYCNGYKKTSNYYKSYMWILQWL